MKNVLWHQAQFINSLNPTVKWILTKFLNQTSQKWNQIILVACSAHAWLYVFILGFHYKITFFFCLILFKFFLLKKTEPPCFNGFWRPSEEQRLCWWSVLSVVCRHSVPAAGYYINKFVTSWHQFVMEAKKRKRKKEAENIIQNFGSQALLLHITVIIWNFYHVHNKDKPHCKLHIDRSKEEKSD